MEVILMKNRLLIIFATITIIGINAQEPTDAARKIDGILKKMGVTDTAGRREHYIEVSPDARFLTTYNTNHQHIGYEPISARIRELLNKKETTKTEQEEETFFCYSLGTKYQADTLPNATKTNIVLRIENIIFIGIASSAFFCSILCLPENKLRASAGIRFIMHGLRSQHFQIY